MVLEAVRTSIRSEIKYADLIPRFKVLNQSKGGGLGWGRGERKKLIADSGRRTPLQSAAELLDDIRNHVAR